MATSTSSFYYNKINVSYPYAGKDNDSQTFRNNFTNIQNALKSTDELVNTLKLGLVTTDHDNDFNFNTIRRANLRDCSVSVLDDTTNVRSGSVTIDYRRGTYQRFKVNSGFTNFQIINWPVGPSGEKLGGRLVISVDPYSVNTTQIDFSGDTATTVVPVDRINSLYEFISKQTVFFEIWSDDSGSTIFVKELGYKSAITTTGTNIIALDSLTIGTNKYSVGSNYSTVVYTNTGTNPKIGRIALIRDTYSTSVPVQSAVPGTTTTFVVSAADRILPGATFTFPTISTSTVYTVTALTTGTTIVATPAFDTSILGTGCDLVFLNPQYAEQPSIVTFKNDAQTTSTGIAGDLKGTIYASSSSLYIAYEDYGTNQKNWFEIKKTTQPISNKTTDVATTEFVHNLVDDVVHTVLPYGSIIMWHGSAATVPSGWALCDGSNSTPDLRNRFIIGASSDSAGVAVTTVTGSTSTTGGSKDAITVEHNHGITDPGHSHTKGAVYPYDSTGSRAEQNQSPAPPDDYTSFNVSTGASFTGITINNSGESGTNKNLPPYYALCYIMKTSTGA